MTTNFDNLFGAAVLAVLAGLAELVGLAGLAGLVELVKVSDMVGSEMVYRTDILVGKSCKVSYMALE